MVYGDLEGGHHPPAPQRERSRMMQVRVFREPGGTFQVVCSPRRRTGLVPVVARKCTKEQVVAEVLKNAGAENQIMAAIRAAKAETPSP